ncbi:MAG: hypothetical protein J6Y86_08885 [Pseudobutyrivibrio sp.]|nr:hypothetical protein [Pseudobutyrivibrio sp.]
MDLRIKKNVLIAKIALLIFLTVFSFFVASSKASKLPVFEKSVSTLEESKSVVMKVTGATIGLSFIISMLPDDWGTPLADTIADLNKYFVLLLGMLFLEGLLISKGIPVTFKVLVPIALILLIAYLLTKKKILKVIAKKFIVLSLVVIFAVPCSTAISSWLCNGGMTYVDETVTSAEEGAEKVEDLSGTESDKGFYEKVSAIFSTAIDGVKDLFNYYKGMVGKFINSLAILVVAYFVIPVATFLLLLWILNQLFQFEGFRIGVPKVLNLKLGKVEIDETAIEEAE